MPRRARVRANDVAQYLSAYVERYRREYNRFTSAPPEGAGYPRLPLSPYLTSKALTCHLAMDGAAIVDMSNEPEGRWDILGGPAILVDYEESRTPPEVTQFLRQNGLLGQPIGIYRVVAPNDLPQPVWEGSLSDFVSEASLTLQDGTRLQVFEYSFDLNELISRLTFGALGTVTGLHFLDATEHFWVPQIIRDLGFATSDRARRRFYNYLEILAHSDRPAWDPRSVWVRAANDVRRDFIDIFSRIGANGGTINVGRPEASLMLFYDRLTALSNAIEGFRSLLANDSNHNESVFHNYLKSNSILLDVYGMPESKPRFHYPSNMSPLGKSYVEPDFIVRYPGNSYKLIELERPSKLMATKRGESRSEIAQAAFQIAEWKTFIKNHYEILRDKWPGISTSFSTMIVISRSTEDSFGTSRNAKSVMELYRSQYSVDEILTYDDLVARAEHAYIRLSGITNSTGPSLRMETVDMTVARS